MFLKYFYDSWGLARLASMSPARKVEEKCWNTHKTKKICMLTISIALSFELWVRHLLQTCQNLLLALN